MTACRALSRRPRGSPGGSPSRLSVGGFPGRRSLARFHDRKGVDVPNPDVLAHVHLHDPDPGPLRRADDAPAGVNKVAAAQRERIDMAGLQWIRRRAVNALGLELELLGRADTGGAE